MVKPGGLLANSERELIDCGNNYKPNITKFIKSDVIFKKNLFLDENCRRGQFCHIKVRLMATVCFFLMYKYVYHLSNNTNKHLI